MSAVLLYRVDPSHNLRRFYRLDVQRDLFGFWLLVREWGRIGRPGRTRVTKPTLYAYVRKRRRRGLPDAISI